MFSIVTVIIDNFNSLQLTSRFSKTLTLPKDFYLKV